MRAMTEKRHIHLHIVKIASDSIQGSIYTVFISAANHFNYHAYKYMNEL